MKRTLILNNKQVQQKINRIAYEIFENNYEEKELVIIGIHGSGFVFAKKLADAIAKVAPVKIRLSELNINKENPLKAKATVPVQEKEFAGKTVLLVDDVLNTGKVLMYAAKFLLDFPVKRLVTAVLVNRRHRSFPIRADYVGLTLSTTLQEHIAVEFRKNKDAVYLE